MMPRLLSLVALLAACLAVAKAAPAPLIKANEGQFRAVDALVTKAGLTGMFQDESLAYTFFLPLDHAFGTFKEYLPTLDHTKLSDILQAIQAADPAKAKQFLEQHIVPAPIRTVEELLQHEEIKSLAGVAISISGDAAYINVMELDGYSGTIAGPLAIPVGRSVVFVLSDGLLGDPAVVLGHGPIEVDETAEDEFDVIFEDEPSQDANATAQQEQLLWAAGAATAAPPAPEGGDGHQEL